YLRAYLKAYAESKEFRDANLRTLREDIHYAFFEYAGSNLAHYLFCNDGSKPEASDAEMIRAQFLSNRIFLLADRDEGKESAHKRLTDLNSHHFHFWVTAGVEVENLVSAQVLSAILPELISSLKTANVSEFGVVEADYKNVRLGCYLRGRLGAACPD